MTVRTLLRPPALLRATLLGALALSAPGSSPLTAQTPGYGPILLEMTWGARATGLGGAPQLAVADPDHLFASPAFSGTDGFRFSGMPIGSTATALSMATGFRGFGGGISVGLRTLEYRGDPPGETPGGIDGILARGEVGRSTQAATVGYARTLLGFDLGVGGTILTDRADAERDTEFTVDVGLARELVGLDLALNVRNLGEGLTLAGTEVDAPILVELLAAGYGEQLGPLDLGFTGRIARRADDDVLVGGGLEIAYWPIQGRTFIARIGAQNVPEGEASPLSLGGSFLGDQVVLDYAFRPVDGLDDLHVITVGWR